MRSLFVAIGLVAAVLGFLLSLALQQFGAGAWVSITACATFGAVLGPTLTLSYLRRREQAERRAAHDWARR